MTDQFSLKATLAAGTWTDEPEILEIITRQSKKPNLLSVFSPEQELGRYRYFRRLIVYYSDNRFIDDYGNGDAQFSQQTSDSFMFIIKAPTVADAKQILSDLYDIFKVRPFNATYDKVEVLTFNLMQERGVNYYVGHVRCFNVAGVA